MMTSVQDSNRIEDSRRRHYRHITDEEKLEGKKLFSNDSPLRSTFPFISEEGRPVIKGSEISTSLLLNERPGVQYLCCDRFFKCDGRNMVVELSKLSDIFIISLHKFYFKIFKLTNIWILNEWIWNFSLDCARDLALRWWLYWIKSKRAETLHYE